jgi:ATP-dependent RNA helicase SUPV3L1/SUV3
VESLETLDERLRAGSRTGGGAVLPDAAREALGWSEDEARAILRGLGFAPVNRPKAGEAIAWRRRDAARGKRPEPGAARPAAHSPFAALAVLQPAPAAPEPSPRRRRRRKPKAAQP